MKIVNGLYTSVGFTTHSVLTTCTVFKNPQVADRDALAISS